MNDVLAEVGSSILPIWLVATLPLWPLVGAAVVGLMLAFNRYREHAQWPVVFGAGVAALLGLVVLFDVSKPLPGALEAAAHHDDAAHGAEDHGTKSGEWDAHGAPADAGHSSVAPEHVALASFAPPHGDAEQPSLTRASNGHGETKPVIDYAAGMYPIYNWISLGAVTSLGLDPATGTTPESAAGRWIAVNFFFDPITGVMLFVVTFIAFLIVVYSISYMKHHGHRLPGYERFFAFMGIFIFSMTMLVLAGNFVLLYLGWELVGLSSYLLIGFFYEKDSAAAAAKKAFLVNRIGDFGFALGIFALYFFISPLAGANENPLDYSVVFKYAAQLTQGQVTLVTLLLLCGALGKSAQLPLYVWLPDAMEGPSPVSALIHAATMVTAGVYMIARCGPLFAFAPVTLNVILFIGVAGSLFAAMMAMAQYDMKRILAYSTMSQLAYMFAALGAAAPSSAIFHLYTHAFFKALLFLAAGSVMHAMGDVIDLRRFSGLRSVLPTTFRLMGVGCLALAGFPLLAGFWSKDEIIHAVMAANPVAGWILLLVAFMTAYYTFRMFFLCFNGPVRLPEEAGDHPHDADRYMALPMTILAVGAIFAGYVGVSFAADPSSAFLGFLLPHAGGYHPFFNGGSAIAGPHHEGGVAMMYISAAIAIAGIALAYVRYGGAPQDEPDRKLLGGLWDVWNHKFYVDEIYDAVFVTPLRKLGDFFYATDRNGIDGLVWFFASIPRGLSWLLRTTQQGALQGYALSMVLGMAALLIIWSVVERASAG